TAPAQPAVDVSSLSLPADGGAVAWGRVLTLNVPEPLSCQAPATAYVPTPQPRMYAFGPRFPDGGTSAFLYLPPDTTPSWTGLPQSSPPPTVSGGAIAYVSAGGRSEILLFGGNTTATAATYRFNLDAGTSPIAWVQEPYDAPTQRYSAVAVLDSVGGQM